MQGSHDQLHKYTQAEASLVPRPSHPNFCQTLEREGLGRRLSRSNTHCRQHYYSIRIVIGCCSNTKLSVIGSLCIVHCVGDNQISSHLDCTLELLYQYMWQECMSCASLTWQTFANFNLDEPRKKHDLFCGCAHVLMFCPLRSPSSI